MRVDCAGSVCELIVLVKCASSHCASQLCELISVRGQQAQFSVCGPINSTVWPNIVECASRRRCASPGELCESRASVRGQGVRVGCGGIFVVLHNKNFTFS